MSLLVQILRYYHKKGFTGKFYESGDRLLLEHGKWTYSSSRYADIFNVANAWSKTERENRIIYTHTICRETDFPISIQIPAAV